MFSTRVDLLNTILLLTSFALAYILPFHLFLFAYAVLGPLHYLTEISWLKERDFFTKNPFDARLVLVGSLICVIALLEPFRIELLSGATILFIAFFFPVVLFMLAGKFLRLIGLSIVIILGILLSVFDTFVVIFAIFLPTLIHVFIFTALFMLYGAHKSKSKIGYINVALLFFLGILFFLLPTITSISPSRHIVESYTYSFGILHTELGKLFDVPINSRRDIVVTEWGITIMQFIAFAYTYHYLNWFSKTKIVRWHESVKKYAFTIIVLWILSVSLYAYSYLVGLTVLYFLSMLHVLLEFPLNYRTIQMLGDPIKKLLHRNVE